MPVGPKNLSSVRHPIIAHVIKTIDDTMLDQHRSRRYVTGPSTDYVYSIPFNGVLSPQEQAIIADIYVSPEVGWGAVQVINETSQCVIKLFLLANSELRQPIGTVRSS
jgi:hypothetical protein